MRPKTLGLAVSAAVLAGASPSSGQVNISHDGSQTVYSITAQSGRPFEVSAAFACPGKEPCRPGIVRVVFGTYTRKVPKYDEDHALSLVADGDTLTLPPPQYAVRQAAANQVYENIVLMMPIDSFLATANADRVAYVIGSEEGELSDKQREALAALAEEVLETEEPRASPDAGNP